MSEPKKLFMIYIGGSHEHSLIELHDMRFVIADTIENTFSSLRKSWWGKPSTLHLDAWGIIDWADGHDICVQKEKPFDSGNEQLYFVNLGGYDSNQFTELHKNILLVAKDNVEAKAKAVKQISNWESPHKDYLFEIENTINLSEQLEEQGVAIHLLPNLKEKPFDFTCRYVPLGK